MKPSPKSKTSSQPSRRASRQHRPSLALLLSLAAIAILGLYPPRAHAALSRGPNSPYRHNAERTAPRTLVIAVPGASWSDLRQADMPNLHQLMAHGASALMPVAKPSDADPNRTWATLSAGRPAAGAPSLGAVRVTPEVGVWTDNTAVHQANRRANTGARVGLLGQALQTQGIRGLVLSERYQQQCPALTILADQAGWGAQLVPLSRSHALREKWIRAAVDRWPVVLFSITSVAQADARSRPRSPSDLPKPKAAALKEADRLLGLALAALQTHGGRVLVFAPVSPHYSDLHHRTLGPAIAYDTTRPHSAGLLTSSSTRWPGLVTAADIAPTLLSWSHASGVGEAGMRGRVIEVTPRPDALSRLDALDRMLSERFRLRFTAGKWYLAYGGLVFLAALALGVWRPQGLSRLGAPALGVALAPVGLLLAPVVGLDRPALHLTTAAAITAVLALLGARARRPAGGLAAVMMVGSALLVLDVILGSPMMRRSTFGFGVMFGARFYGIGNEYMGFLSAMAVIGLGALLQLAPRAKCLAAVAGALLVLVIGAPWWGANWGGGVATAAALVALWVRWRRWAWHRSLVLAAIVVAAAALIPAALDLLNPAAARTHIGASLAALLESNGATLAGTGFVMKYKYPDAKNGERMLSGLTVKWTGVTGPTFTAAS